MCDPRVTVGRLSPGKPTGTFDPSGAVTVMSAGPIPGGPESWTLRPNDPRVVPVHWYTSYVPATRSRWRSAGTVITGVSIVFLTNVTAAPMPPTTAMTNPATS